ncbi:MAG: ABC transporter ATP-binding protein [Betaproteobacteria bacterium]|jgi:branched-chain amino acid transport system ATP-binding protein|nr:ABC transporter ATP-binding protein [Betaproteobacteria bacterium]NBT68268.1 ABC transporter ATP-binding protein [Betaproteobacteria bacterium]NBY06356.1 ABC transporter ATP-binding protein [Betaproteobacteria bacterium]
MSHNASPPLLDIQHLSLSFGGIQAISDFDLKVHKSEILALIGPNGAGKTSVLNTITRVFTPQSGEIIFKERDISHLPRHAIASLGIARTFQNIELFESATVLDNLLLGRHRFFNGHWWQQLLRTPHFIQTEEDTREQIEHIIDFLDLSPWRHSPISGLPYGVRKIVELARALCAKPELLFLDEPASGLNTEETRDLAFWIDDIRTDLGITVVMVEHDMSLVSAVADRVVCMSQGKILASGTPQEVQSNTDVIAAYLGTSS